MGHQLAVFSIVCITGTIALETIELALSDVILLFGIVAAVIMQVRVAHSRFYKVAGMDGGTHNPRSKKANVSALCTNVKVRPIYLWL